jgi:hypothetical protein
MLDSDWFGSTDIEKQANIKAPFGAKQDVRLPLNYHSAKKDHI